MSKIDLKIDVASLAKDIDTLGNQILEDFSDAMKQLPTVISNEAERLASQRLNKTRQSYMNAFSCEQLASNVFVISLDDSASFLEEGYGPFDMKPGFLSSPLAKTSKEGKKYFDVPLQQSPYSKGTNIGGKGITSTRDAIAAVMKDKTVSKRVEEYNSSSKGLAKFGKVTTFTNTGNPNLEGLTKISDPEGKSQSKYFLFRRVSENSSSSSWIHPGFDGAHIFSELEKFTYDQIDLIIKRLVE